MAASPIGKHCILELHDCPSHLLDDLTYVRETVAEASRQGMSTLLEIISTQFEPQGVTALGLLAESHISVHTWPELGYGAVDIFTCGDRAEPERACRFMIERFKAGDYRLQVLPRGDAIPRAAARATATTTTTTSPAGAADPAEPAAADQEDEVSCPQGSRPTSGSPNTSVRPTCTTTV